MTFTLQSPAFKSETQIPVKYTCEGLNISPPLKWYGAPMGTQSYVLFVEDPDVPTPQTPMRTWVHWIVYDIPAEVQSADEGELPVGGKCGRNDWMRADYGGPCPPIGRHRYFHTLYALDRFIANFESPTKRELLKSMEGHVLDKAVLIGTYKKAGRFVAR